MGDAVETQGDAIDIATAAATEDVTGKVVEKSTREVVVAGTAIDGIVGTVGKQSIVTDTPRQTVATVACENVVAVPAVEGVRASLGVESIVTVAAQETVVSATRDEDVVVGAAV